MDFSQVKAALEARRFKVTVFPTGKAAAEYLNEELDGVSIGFGGSVTLRELGLYDSLSAHNTVFSHWNVPEGKTAADMRRIAMGTDVYLTSVNALAETGELINIDGTGNRTAGTLFGHKKVYFVIGRNKLAEDYDKALWRARNVASPKNAQRLGANTPCAEKGDRCYDCKSPGRICRALVVLWEALNGCETEVVLVDEELGY
ncbi:MAG: lactate utilization protein [Oscillospiraceae bacterium]|nr:lactate utilization protein [Oscillospiraceae bacterium]